VAKTKLTTSTVEGASPTRMAYELRDTAVPGFLLKVTPTGSKVFMLAYRTTGGRRRKPAIGRFGELSVDRARTIAKDWLYEVRRGGDPAETKGEARRAATMAQLCERFIEEYSKPKNTWRTVRVYQGNINRHILPAFGRMKVRDVKRADIADLISRLRHIPTTANRVLCCLRKMFNMAEVWGYREDFTNPCRHVPTYPEKGETRFITDAELVRIFDYLDRAEYEALEHPTLILAVRLQFGFAARMSEILSLRWDWIDFTNRRVAWPTSKTGAISKPLSSDMAALLADVQTNQRETQLRTDFVCPSLTDPNKPLPEGTYQKAWARILVGASVPHVGTHGIRHRAATDIANSGVPIKVGMQLTAHKTVAQFMRYVHPEDDLVRAAAEHVARRRSGIVNAAGKQSFRRQELLR
jgi:integrase